MIRMLPLGRSVLLGLLLIFCCTFPLRAQSNQVKGTLLDAATQDPLVGASVSIPKLGLGTFTDEKGTFSLKLPSSKPTGVTVNISYAGYKTLTLSLEELSAGSAPIRLESTDYTAEDVVITATKGFQQAQSDVTVSIAVVKPRSLDLQALPAVDKAISQIPGVDNQDGQINIRGSSGYAYGVGSRVMVTLDGLPLLTGDAGAADLDLIPVDNIAQIEVMKGASSVLYGSSALGGVINVITADPGEKPRTAIRVRGGLFDNPSNPILDWDGDANAWSGSAHVFHSRRIGNLDLTLQTNFIKESGYRQGTDTEEYRNVLMLKYRPESIKGLTLGLNASLSIDSSGQILYWRGYYPDTTIRDNDTVVSGGALTPTLDDGGFRRQLKTVMALDPVIKYLTPKGDLFWYRGRFLRNTNANDANQSSINNIFYNDFLYQTTLAKKISWVSGVTFTTANIQGDSLYGGTYVFNGDTISSDGGHSSNSLGIYTQFDGKFGPLNASLGFRYESVQIDGAAREAQPTLRAGLNYKIAEGTNVRASFGQAFRVPSIA
ncbi:MAG: TonB-dependent receptor, partial [Bacteroidota bacterium]